MIIGHEMTHGFDDEGSKFDGSGNMKDWWTAEDRKRFDERVALIVKQFDSYVVAGDTHVKGNLVSGESAADLGGLTIAYKALERVTRRETSAKECRWLHTRAAIFHILRTSVGAEHQAGT